PRGDASLERGLRLRPTKVSSSWFFHEAFLLLKLTTVRSHPALVPIDVNTTIAEARFVRKSRCI
ncbi:hypothetical protein GIB67_037273, partial [Kingdonia uniflora]